MTRRLLLALLIASPLSAQLPDGYVDEEVLGGFDAPVGLTHDANGRMYVWEKGGRAYVIENGARLEPPLLDISDEVGNWRDFGMLGFALDPDFLSNGYLYTYYVVDRHHLLYYGTPSYDPNKNEYFAATIGRVTRFQADPTTGFKTLVPNSRTVLLGETADSGVPILHQSHGTGSLVFGSDGTLLVSAGDGASYDVVDAGSQPGTYWSDALADGIIRPEENVGAFRCQMIGSLSGKILRLDPATGDGLPSNPFYDPAEPRAPRSRVWALGLRNPFRFTVRPGTGSADPAAGDPGVLYVGDVGWNLWEDLHVVEEGGMNLGWPLFEGLKKQDQYYATPTEDLDAPNPLYDGVTCNAQYFTFQELIAQEREDHSPSFPNPCDANTQIPPSTPTFMHRRPALEWYHGKNAAYVPVFHDGKAARKRLGTADCPVAGESFRGTCSVGGVWLSGLGFGAPYKGLYFHADHSWNWIRALDFDGDDVLHEVLDFGPVSTPTFLGEDPADGSLLYVQLATSSVRRIRYTGDGNVAPQAVASADVEYGPSPRTVHLDATGSFDPEGGPLTFLWAFEDGSTSTLPSPLVTFDNPGGAPAHQGVELTVTDEAGAQGHAHLDVHLDNTPPVITDVLGATNGAHYSTAQDTPLTLDAVVSDAEHGPAELSYSWRLFLHHSSHVHPEAEITTPTAQVLLTPTPCSGEFYAYSVLLTVSDAEGLSSSRTLWFFPDCPGAGSATVVSPTPSDVIDPGDPWMVEVATTGVVTRVDLYVDGELTGTAFAPPYRIPWTPDAAGVHMLAAVAQVDGEGAVTSLGVPIDVRAPLPVSASVERVRDDAEEQVIDGSFTRNGRLLHLGAAGAQPTLVGLRFALDVPQGAKLVSADLQLSAETADEGLALLTVRGEASDDAAPLQDVPGSLSGRPLTAAVVTWMPQGWRYPDARGARQRTPDLKAVLQEIVDRPGWQPGAHVVLIVRGFGQRRAHAFRPAGSDEARLTVEYAQ